MPPKSTLTDAERFAEKVTPEPNTGCWLWTASVTPDGYGYFWCVGRRRMLKSHRVARELSAGPIPKGLSVLHRCDQPGCVNPDHLFLGTQQDNIRDMHAKKRARNVRGSACGQSKLTEGQVIRIRALLAERRLTQKQIGQMFGVRQTQVSHIAVGASWRHLAS